ncbi:MAG: hypothetical protein IKW18_02255, partial [Clostridia bacterium]|nr:hypothetical protein [Clostridia bacterium]
YIKNNMVAEAKDSFKNERRLLPLVNKALAQYEACLAFVEKETVSDVVYVTYTADDGKETTFFINYNSSDVAIEYAFTENGNEYRGVISSRLNPLLPKQKLQKQSRQTAQVKTLKLNSLPMLLILLQVSSRDISR